MPKGIVKENVTRRKNKFHNEHGGGRKPFPIDWNIVQQCIVGGSSGIQVAAYLGIHFNTLYSRCQKDNGVNFDVYWLEHWQKGNSMIHNKQFQKAVRDGNTEMLKHLGQHRLNQVNKVEQKIQSDVTISQKKRLELPRSDRMIKDE